MHSPAPAAFCASKQVPSRRRRHSLKSTTPFLQSPGCPCPRGQSTGKRCSPGAHLPERNALTFLIGVHLSLSGVFTTQGVRRSLLPGTGSGASCPSPSDTDVHEEAGRKSSAKAKHRESLGEMALQHQEGLERAGVQAARMRGTQPVLVCRMRWAKKLCFSSSFSFYSPLVNVAFVPWVWSLTHLPAFCGPALGSFRLRGHRVKP